MIPLISSGFTDKLCEASDVYQRIRATPDGPGGRDRRREGREGWVRTGEEVAAKLSETAPSS